MKITELGVREGKIHADKFESGKEYTIDDSLFKAFDSMGVCELVKEQAVIDKTIVSNDEPKQERAVIEPSRRGRPKKGAK